jgi:6-pyruvoyltetrahydropterin/6-carboxytetrahydropterin synthase
MRITVSKVLGELCVAHRLPNHSGACRNLHGHNYEITVEASGQISSTTGMVKDFQTFDALWKDLKALFDHRTLLWDKDPLCSTMENVCKCAWLPTAENIALYIATEYSTQYGITAVEVKETGKCKARVDL